MAANASSAVSNPAGSGGSYLPGLLGIAAALAIWMFAQPIADKARSLQQQIGIAGQTRSLSGNGTVAELEDLARQAAERRSAIERRLQTDELPAVAHAKVLHDLRQRCAAAGVQNCAVKYVDDTPPAGGSQRLPTPASNSGAGSTAAPTLTSLGLSRSKAVISGLFQDLEFTKLINQLEREDSGIWRVIAMTVRGNRFEIEAELITRPQQTAPGAAQR